LILRRFNRAAWIQRKVPVKRRRKEPRRGEVRCAAYIAWNHETFGCLAAGRNPNSPCSGRSTFHHVRHWTNPDGTREFTGKIDTRGVILCEGHHQHGPQAIHKLTAPGAWEEYFAVDIQGEIARKNEQYIDEGHTLPMVA
jgi:hypothetical protein